MAHQSVRNWLAYRASHVPWPTAEESVRNWLAYRQRQLGEGMAHECSPGQRLEQAERGPSVPDERQRVRSHGYDLGL